jgi:hypothetical protein
MRTTTTRLMIAAFLIAAPVGVALGYFTMAILPPELAERAYSAFLALTVIGALGIAFFGRRNEQPKSEPAVEQPQQIDSNVVQFEQRMRPLRPAKSHVHAPANVTALRVRRAQN